MFNGTSTVGKPNCQRQQNRGDLLIGASKNMAGQRMADGTPYPSGMAIAHVKLVDCVPFNAKQHGKAAGCDRDTAQDCEDSGDWAWIFADARAIEPFPVKGRIAYALFGDPHQPRQRHLRPNQRQHQHQPAGNA
ncbi:hypothetical protein J9253_05075 [Thiothrix litoralis]|uniref:Uncharacterized protein n=1 Tax=Thiothrix litoralis TaxID=2891210 RepID=A0ABX7WY47_9GAMM|nr:hypothetical protein [Thiothrix litoralis]QTR47313.1 hypothetical protein J9253_05075 [Thiothrix litoralis]